MSSSPPTLGMGVTTLEGLVAVIASLGLAWDVDRNIPRRLAREADRSAFSSWEPTAGSATTLFRATRGRKGEREEDEMMHEVATSTNASWAGPCKA